MARVFGGVRAQPGPQLRVGIRPGLRGRQASVGGAGQPNRLARQPFRHAQRSPWCARLRASGIVGFWRDSGKPRNHLYQPRLPESQRRHAPTSAGLWEGRAAILRAPAAHIHPSGRGLRRPAPRASAGRRRPPSKTPATDSTGHLMTRATAAAAIPPSASRAAGLGGRPSGDHPTTSEAHLPPAPTASRHCCSTGNEPRPSRRWGSGS